MLFLFCWFQIWIHFLSLHSFVYRLNFVPKAVHIFSSTIMRENALLANKRVFSFKHRKRYLKMVSKWYMLSPELVTIGLVIRFIDHSQVVTTLADSHTTNHSTLNLLSVLSLVFTVRFLATDLSQCHCNYSTCAAFSSHTESSPHCLTPLTSDSLNSDLRLSLFWLYSWQLTIWHISYFSDWTLHWNYSDFQMNSQLLLASRYIAWGLTSQKTCPLPNNGCPLLLHIRWNVFI
jgi:hypothetical protein